MKPSIIIKDESTKMGFGKHKGQTITEVMKDNASYLLWAHENVDFFKLDERLLKIVKLLAKRAPKKKVKPFNGIPELDGGYEGLFYDVDSGRDIQCPF